MDIQNFTLQFYASSIYRTIGYKAPERKYFSQTAIPKKYSQLVEATKKDMCRGDNFAITSDGWSSAVNLNPYVSFTYHFINQDWQYASLNLETLFALESHTGTIRIWHLNTISNLAN